MNSNFQSFNALAAAQTASPAVSGNMVFNISVEDAKQRLQKIRGELNALEDELREQDGDGYSPSRDFLKLFNAAQENLFKAANAMAMDNMPK